MSQSLTHLLKRSIIAGLFAVFIAAPALAVASPVATPVSAGCEDRVLGIPPWYRGLTNGVEGDCALKSPSDFAVAPDPSNPDDKGRDGLTVYVWKIILNVVDMVLVITLYIAIGFIMYGGFLWLAAGARPDMVTKGRKAIMNAAIGLVISMAAIAIVNLVFGIIG